MFGPTQAGQGDLKLQE